MNIEIHQRDGAHVVTLTGELVGGQTAGFVDRVTNLLASPKANILIDLSGVPFMNSIGLSELVRVTAQANVQEGRVILVNPSPFVAGVLNTTQLSRFFEVCDSLDDALAKVE